MRLDELIAALEAEDQTLVMPIGFYNPHSFRGFYEQLAFEPAENVTVAEMLASARGALGATYQGWKGGYFKMVEYTDCWISEEGTSYNSTNISPLLLKLMFIASRAWR